MAANAAAAAYRLHAATIDPSLKLFMRLIPGISTTAILVAMAGWVVFATSVGGSSPLPNHWDGSGKKSADQPRLKTARDTIRYDRDIRPILSDRCFKCHGPDPATRQADLRLDIPHTEAGKDEEPMAIVPGLPNDSEVMLRILSTDDSDRMPPPGSNKRSLSDDEQALVRRWIEQGAEYEPHWSFVAPQKVDLPEVTESRWANNPIDRWIFARLSQDRIEPSPPADPLTLFRRLFLDLTGLPPTPQEIAEYTADGSDDRYERWVHRLLNEEPYRSRHAEHLASRWLDAARYADTIGIHTDAGRQMWPWRDWVLRAYRDNLPFNQFVTEQLAGDLIPDATLEQKIASGFNRNHVMTDEGGAIPEEYLVEYAVDRTATTGSVFLGLTLGCARCHEHKFDPISQGEFFGLYAFFNSLEEPGLYSQLPDANRAFEPFISVPAPDQKAELERLDAQIAELNQALRVVNPADADLQRQFLEEWTTRIGWSDADSKMVSAASEEGATLTITPEQTVVASGKNPSTDVHTVVLSSHTNDLRLIALEALPHATLFENRVGRAPNGNAVLTHVSAEARSVADPTQSAEVRFRWAWANYEQANGNYDVINVLDADQQSGWAVGGHLEKGPRLALLMAEEPFGFEGGTTLTVRLHYRSMFPQHIFGNVRLRLGRLQDAWSEQLPLAMSRWYMAGPFESPTPEFKPYETQFGPEQASHIDPRTEFGPQARKWQFNLEFKDEALNTLATGTNVSFVGRNIWSPSARTIAVSLGSDDGLELFVNGQSVLRREVERSLAADQDSAQISLRPGLNSVVLKVVNTGGNAGFYYRAVPDEKSYPHELALALLPTDSRGDESNERLGNAWRIHFSPDYRAAKANLTGLETQRKELLAKTPLTMIMHELETPRDTYVLLRGVYDKPDMNQKVERSVPAALGKWPTEQPRNRLGLAHWMTSEENPLLARVAVNRVWEHFFGTGLVATSEDFGMQGEWPSHPELLDWLAVEFRSTGWDLRRLIHMIVTSETYRQSSRMRPDLRDVDPQNRLLASFPRRRLTAEQIRDQALFVSGLLVEKFGGPSVKPYQPEGLWQEVAMLASNTRIYQQGTGPELWRRSLYTYWKRACPPPSLMAFDAPTRESCTIRRSSTNTPLQALVLWNDPQFVEAARAFAQRALMEASDDDSRIAQMFLQCTSRTPEEPEAARLAAALNGFREGFKSDVEAAEKLLAIGEAPRLGEVPSAELAAWTMLANALLNLDETITVD